MTKKIAVVTGGSGGIGGGFVEILSHAGYEVFIPVRNLATDTLDRFKNKKEVHMFLSDVGNQESTNEFFRQLREQVDRIDVVIMAAGTFKWDKYYPGDTKEEKEIAATKALMAANLYTKQTVDQSLRMYFSSSLKNITVVPILSHAADFGVDHPYRQGEEGYHVAMREGDNWCKKLDEEGLYKKVLIQKPGLIDTPMARIEFTKETIGEDPNWSTIQKPKEYALATAQATGLI